MAKRIEGTTEKLLECAKAEFLSCGYERASLRVIAEKANSSKGAIYIRYPDKRNLFLAIIQPATEGFFTLMRQILGQFGSLPPEDQKKLAIKRSDDGFDLLVDYIYDHYDEFKLLLCSGETVSWQEFLHCAIDIDNAATYAFIENAGSNAISSGRLTPELAHLLSSAFYTGMFEVIVHDMPKDIAIQHITRMRNFYNAGWSAIFTGKESSYM